MRRGKHQDNPPNFDDAFRARLAKLFAWRRDVRRFKSDPVASSLIEELVRAAALAPSVGNSQPWRFVSVETLVAREAVIANFNACNAAALASYEGERAALYASLKLSGLREAPMHLAVFCDHATEAGFGLGRKTMPEALDYSVVAAIHTFWLSARAKNSWRWMGIDPRPRGAFPNARRSTGMEAHRLSLRGVPVRRTSRSGARPSRLAASCRRK